ncbi:hypothetical protein RR48_11565 [Papilio machaon]|uniref:MADF domain-containing protein n=1 Tax=Papilio machaon TaxID=76193 RepID=A0A194R460_PAPMA|nr:hypothetical protein RR48_11565 [Papilio machaon]
MQKIDTETFITEIRNRPPIWCSTNAQYKNKNVVRKKWDEIWKLFPGLKVADLKKKWKNLRDHYRKELKRCSVSGSGDPDGDRYESSWKYFDNMSFTKDELMPVICEVNVKQEEQDSEDDNNSASAEEEYTETSVECKRESNTEQIVNERKRTAQDLRQEYLEIEKKKLKLLENESQRNRTDEFSKSQDYHFLMSLLPEIEKLPLVNKFRLRNRFNDVLLEELHSIVISPNYPTD